MDGPKNDNPDMRWKAVLVYDSGNTGSTQTVFFEEIEDLDQIIEGGPDWNTLVSCTVTLNRVVADQSTAA